MQTPSETTLKLLDALIEEAIWTGRMYWDGYYGSGTSFHFQQVEASPAYAAIKKHLEDTS